MNAEKTLLKHIPTLLSLWRGKTDTSALNKKELKSVSNALLSLQRGLTGNRKLAGSGYMQNQDLLGAYLLYYWPVSYMQISYAINSCPHDLPVFNQSTVTLLDVGSGPAPASIAICDHLSSSNIESTDITLIDSSSKTLDLARKIYNKAIPQAKTKVIQSDLQNGLPPITGQFDIIVLSHSLNELWKDKDNRIKLRADFLIQLSKHLKPDGILLISEPALLETSRNLIQVRDTLVQNGFKVLSPCLKSKICPAVNSSQNQTCHAEIQWQPCEPVTSIARLCNLDRESVKMSFFIFSKSEFVPIQLQSNYYRIVSDGMLNKSGRIRYLLCDGEKRLPLSAKNGDVNAKQTGFFKLKRYDIVTVQSPEIRGDSQNPALGINEETKLEISKFSV